MTFNEAVEIIMTIAIAPLAGWIISVERRIGALGGIHDKIDKVDCKVDLLLAHALDTQKRDIRVDARIAESDRAGS